MFVVDMRIIVYLISWGNVATFPTQSPSSSSSRSRVTAPHHQHFLHSGWKRLLLAEGPRQVLNAITLYSVAKDQDFSFDIHVYQQEFTTVQGVVLSFMLLTVTIWALSAIRLLVAAVLYWPLLVCHIRGNLKEYCCHKVDKRITQLLADKAQQRRNRGPEPGDKKKAATFSSAMDGGQLPTLPKVELDGDGGSILSMPLYPLSRSDSVDSRRGLLSRAESFGTTGLTRTPTNTSSYPLMQIDSHSTYHARSESVSSNPYSLHRADTANTTHYEIQSPTYQLSRTDTMSTGLTWGVSNASSNSLPQRQPTLPHLPDFPQNRGPPRSASRQGSLPSTRPPMSTRGYGPPSRSATVDPSMQRDRFGPPSRAQTIDEHAVFTPPARTNTAQSARDFAPPTRSNTAQSMREGFGPPPRSGTAASMRSVGRPVYEEFGTGYGVPR